MRLDAARMTQSYVAGTLQWPIHRDAGSADYLAVQDAANLRILKNFLVLPAAVNQKDTLLALDKISSTGMILIAAVAEQGCTKLAQRSGPERPDSRRCIAAWFEGSYVRLAFGHPEAILRPSRSSALHW